MSKLCISGNRAFYSYISLIFSELKKWKKPTLKKFLIFQETELSHISPFGRFHFSPFSGVFIFHLSQVFSFFTFLRCFNFSHFSGVFIFTFLRCFIFHLFWVFLCCCIASGTDLRELFLLTSVFYLTLLPDIWHNLLLSRLPWELAVLPWRLQGLLLSEVRNTDPAHLFVWKTQYSAKCISRLVLFIC